MTRRDVLENLDTTDRKYRNARTLREGLETRLRAARVAELAAHKAREAARAAVQAQFPEVLQG